MKPENVKTFEELEEYMKENAPDWRLEKRTISENKAALLMYPPGEFMYAASFWIGYYDSFPEDRHAIWHSVCHGSWDYVLRDVLAENARLKAVPKIRKAIETVVSQDAFLREIYVAPSKESIRHDSFYTTHWAAESENKSMQLSFRLYEEESGYKVLIFVEGPGREVLYKKEAFVQS